MVMKKIFKGLIEGQVVYFLPKRDNKWMIEVVTGIAFRTNKISNLVIINRDGIYQDEILQYIIDKKDKYDTFYAFLNDYKRKSEYTSIVNCDKKKHIKPKKVHIKVLKRSRFTGEIRSCRVIDKDREGE